MTKINTLKDLESVKKQYNKQKESKKFTVLVCGGGGCVSSGCAEIIAAVKEAVKEFGLEDKAWLYETGCIGTCAVGPVMLIQPDNTFYVNLRPETAKKIIEMHLVYGKIMVEHTFYDNNLKYNVPCIDDIEFFSKQTKIALRNCGLMEYGSLDAYVARDGYKAACDAYTKKKPADIVKTMKESGLQGRGGAGFPAGVKWETGMNAPGPEKYIVCNADEGDPGAFMDRSIIEGDPHSLIEGMMLGGYAIGAHQGYVYVRAEYPLAIERLNAAIRQARDAGILGGDPFGSGYGFDLEIRIGAGAFVCGEETALMNSIEGKRGEPRQKPPFPFQKGLFGKPTIINNVETFANAAAIILNGASWYASIGTAKSKGTKVFALAGDIVNTGIVEVPIGMPLNEIVFEIGGGIPDGKSFKAAQIGGPSGGCITKENLDTPTDYDELKKLGAIMGSGGLIVMSEDTCMVDTARYFMEFIQDESCGKCVACRIGTKRMLEILERITLGNGKEEDIGMLEELGHAIQESALCGLGQTAPNPVLSTLTYFRNEYEAHIRDKKCPAGVCKKLIEYKITDACKRCSLCQRQCPVGAISGDRQTTYAIDPVKCIKCGLCISACKFGAIIKE